VIRRSPGLAGVLGAAWVGAAAAAVAAATHPWHDAIAEARVDAARSRLEVSMRVDAAHLEAMIATRDRVAFDIESATPGGHHEPRLAETVRAAMQARFAPTEGVATGPGRAEDRFDLHWVGAELEGPDCWLHFEWIAPAGAGDPPAARPVQLRATLLIDPVMQQVNTVSVPGFGAARFAAGRTDWTEIGLALPPRAASAMRVARAGEAGPRVLLVPGPGGPRPADMALAGRLRPHARVEVAFWPGRDGEAAPPSHAPPGGWADWAAAALRLRILAEAPGPVHLVLAGSDAEQLAARIPEAAQLAGTLGEVFVIAAAPTAEEHGGSDATGVLERYRRDLLAAGPEGGAAAVLARAIRLADDEDAAAAVLTAITGG
jgi:hypothetical protein